MEPSEAARTIAELRASNAILQRELDATNVKVGALRVAIEMLRKRLMDVERAALHAGWEQKREADRMTAARIEAEQGLLELGMYDDDGRRTDT